MAPKQVFPVVDRHIRLQADRGAALVAMPVGVAGMAIAMGGMRRVLQSRRVLVTDVAQASLRLGVAVFRVEHGPF
jgi:hypothetical protein